MRVNRTRHQRDYVQVPNFIARHGSLSLEAVGLLVRLLSLPDGNGATVERIVSQVPNGKRVVTRAMNELIEAGYVKRARLQDPETGRWVTITTVTDSPEAEANPTAQDATAGKPRSRKVGGHPLGIKTNSKKDTTPPPALGEQEAPAEPQVAPEAPEEGREGQDPFLAKIDREMAREARRVLERLSLHKSLPLTDQEIARLAPKLVPWLREDFRSDEILRCLTAALPERIGSVPGLITFRLANFTPERSAPAATQKPFAPIKRECCDVCEKPFRNPGQSGVCGGCKAEMHRVTARFGVELQPSF